MSCNYIHSSRTPWLTSALVNSTQWSCLFHSNMKSLHPFHFFNLGRDSMMVGFLFFFWKESKSLDTTLGLGGHIGIPNMSRVPLRFAGLHIIPGGEKGKGPAGREYVWHSELQPKTKRHRGDLGFLISVDLDAWREGRRETNMAMTSCFWLWAKPLTGKGYKSGGPRLSPWPGQVTFSTGEWAGAEKAGKHQSPLKSL